MATYSEVLKRYEGAAGKLTRFRGDYCRFRVAFNVDDPDLVKHLQKKGAELYKLLEVGEDYVCFQSASSTIFLPIETILLED